ncbi:MAG: hypothetical protein ABSG57_07025 [Candidatus Bathyarchaeia archaeon]
MKITSKERPAGRISLSLLALISFVASFVIARVFTTISGVVLRGVGFHIHHFWYGIILLAVGGWLGISYDEERIVRLAAVLYGAGGGLIGDEVGLLLTFGNYTTGITYTIVVIFIAFVSAVILFMRYSRAISTEIKGFTRSRASFYFGIILAAVSIAFLTTRNSLIARISTVTTIAACIIIIAYIAQRIRTRH